VLDLGMMPLSDGFLTAAQLEDSEELFPLEVAFCPKCALMQILETVPPEKLFCDNYPYFSSFSETLLAHSRDNALDLIKRRNLTPASFVVELASNDGYLLRNFVEHRIPVLGIDPADGPAKAAEKVGVPTLNTFFTKDLAATLRNEGKQADVIIGNNVLAHVADTNGFVAGIATLLKDTGVAVIECPYVRDLIDHAEFDTIDLKYYEGFRHRVEGVRSEMQRILDELKSAGKRIAGYGAAAKGTIMLNYIGVNRDIIEFVADKNVHKQGKWIPGVRIPIVAPEKIKATMPDYVVILPWNFTDEIVRQQSEYQSKGGRFIVPIPQPRILQPAGART
jgi:SAM-dependent methyltransferase